jgi:hypothetical protein
MGGSSVASQNLSLFEIYSNLTLGIDLIFDLTKPSPPSLSLGQAQSIGCKFGYSTSVGPWTLSLLTQNPRAIF